MYRYLHDTDRALQFDYRPGTDLISRAILTDNQVINMLMKILVPEAAEDHYAATPTEFLDKKKCDVLYAPHALLSTFTPVFIEVQNQVVEKFLVRAVPYSTLIYGLYNKHPILVIIGVASMKVPFMSMPAENSDLSSARQLPCIDCAERCLVMASSTLEINEYIVPKKNYTLYKH